MKEKFTNQYSLSKTLRFSLIPVGKTEENFNKKLLLDEDRERAENYQKVKEYMDRYHKFFIEEALKNFVLNGVDEYVVLYNKSNKSDSEIKQMETLEQKMRTDIVKVLKSYTVNNEKIYQKLSNKDFVRIILPDFLEDENEKEIVSQFYEFTTYFQGFWSNRNNMYTDEAKSTGIAYRCINDNLPKFLDNVKSYEKISKGLSQEVIEKLDEDFKGVYNLSVKDVFDIDYFSFVLTQTGIDLYNTIIGGYSNSDGTKVQGLNEYVNLHNQRVEKSERLPLLKPLFKQILSDRDSISFLPEAFSDDNELLQTINDSFNNKEYGIKNQIDEIKSIISNIHEYKTDKIYISNGLAVTEISNAVFGSWSIIKDAWNAEYEQTHRMGKDAEKYYEKQRKEYKKIPSFSVDELQRLGGSEQDILDYFVKTIQELYDNVFTTYEKVKNLLSNEYKESKRLSKNDNAVEQIKEFLDSVKEFESFVKPLCGSGKEENKDNLFYGKFLVEFENLKAIDLLYNKVRNYVTQKPYNTDKIKLNFQNPQLLGGWDKNKECDYRSVLMRKDGLYYLAIMDKSNNKIFIDAPIDSKDNYEKIDYKLLPDPSKMLPKVFFAKSRLDDFNPSNEILKIREEGSYKKGNNFDLDKCHKFIDFYKTSIFKHEDWKNFGFEFSDTNSYADTSQFFKEVSEQGYTIKYSNVSQRYIEEMIENGSLYLFQIYNKDFSKYSKGTDNLHTMYFKMLFNEENLKDVVYKLSGGAEMFYRDASIKKDEIIVHPKNQPVDNKNPDNAKLQSVFEYDLIKDKRFTKRQFNLHLPISLNFKAVGNSYINNDVRTILKNNKENFVIGIDRGERNLIYVCVVDSDGKLVEQKSFNIIESDNGYKTDYHALLDRREKDRDNARKSWKTIGNIKELKEGYLSQVIHSICQLVIKYDAVIAMEDLNSGFMNSRKKVEKQVYQKFERMLTQKLNYLVDKRLPATAMGGLLNAYQLTNEASKVRKGRQDGIIFYIPAWLTSKIDPVTGFVSLIKPRYTSVNSSIEFFNRFDDISYNSDNNYFEFEIDYSKFEKCNADFKKKWTICTYGERINTFRNPNKNDEWDNQTVNLTDDLKVLFDKYCIDYNVDLKQQILNQREKDFFIQFMKLLSLTLQMRNSITGNVDVDYLISPVKDSEGNFYDSRNYNTDACLPCDADANGAYNIARKGLWAIKQIKQADDETKADISIKNSDWLEYAQTQN